MEILHAKKNSQKYLIFRKNKPQKIKLDQPWEITLLTIVNRECQYAYYINVHT